MANGKNSKKSASSEPFEEKQDAPAPAAVATSPSVEGTGSSPADKALVVQSPAGPVVQPPTAQVSIEPAKPDPNDDFGGVVGEGFEESQDNILPLLVVLQGQSPQVLKSEDGSIRPGDFLNSVTGKVYSGKAGVEFIPVYVKHRFVHWNCREDKGGNGEGFLGEYEPEHEFVQEALAGRGRVMGPIELGGPDGQKTELIETKTLLGIILDGEQIIPVGIPCSSTKLTPLGKYVSGLKNFLMRGRKGKLPLYAHKSRITTEKQERGKNISYNLVFTPLVGGDIEKSLNRISNGDGLFEMAQELYQSIAAGRMKAASMATIQPDAGGGDGEGGGERSFRGGPAVDPNSEDIPF